MAIPKDTSKKSQIAEPDKDDWKSIASWLFVGMVMMVFSHLLFSLKYPFFYCAEPIPIDKINREPTIDGNATHHVALSAPPKELP